MYLNNNIYRLLYSKFPPPCGREKNGFIMIYGVLTAARAEFLAAGMSGRGGVGIQLSAPDGRSSQGFSAKPENKTKQSKQSKAKQSKQKKEGIRQTLLSSKVEEHTGCSESGEDSKERCGGLCRGTGRVDRLDRWGVNRSGSRCRGHRRLCFSSRFGEPDRGALRGAAAG